MRLPILALALFCIAACNNVNSESHAKHVSDLSPPSDVPDGAQEILAAASKLEIYALNPMPRMLTENAVADEDLFHGYEKLGTATLTDEKTRIKIIASIYRGIDDSDGMVAACFNPRHGLHASANGKTVDFVICYECLSMHIYVDGVRHNALTTSAPGATLTRTWQEAGLTIHEDE